MQVDMKKKDIFFAFDPPYNQLVANAWSSWTLIYVFTSIPFPDQHAIQREEFVNYFKFILNHFQKDSIKAFGNEFMDKRNFHIVFKCLSSVTSEIYRYNMSKKQ